MSSSDPPPPTQLQNTVPPTSPNTVRRLTDFRNHSPAFNANVTHSKRRRILKTHRNLSSTQAAQIMLSKAGSEDNIKTVTLARGSYPDDGSADSGSPALQAMTYHSASEHSAISRHHSPDSPTSSSLRMLASVGTVELLDHDPRPTFVIDLHESLPTAPVRIQFANLAFRAHPSLFQTIESDTTEFHKWLLSDIEYGQHFSFESITWSVSTLRKRLRIVSGSYEDEEVENDASFYTNSLPSAAITISPSNTKRSDYFSQLVHKNSDGDSEHTDITTMQDQVTPSDRTGFFDWTRLPLTSSLPEHVRFAKSIDWSATALGPMQYWATDLRQMCNLIFGSPHAAAMYWGPDLVAIYNEAYVPLAGQKHPALMGQSYRVAWAEIWDALKGVFDSAIQTGQATMRDDDLLFINRSNYLEETYFSWSIIPIVAADGTVSGLYNPAFEKTKRKIAERRMLTLREVGEKTALARDVKSFWKAVLNSLDSNPWDTPFVLVYSVGSGDDSESDAASIYSSSTGGAKTCTLEGSLGVPNDHPAAPRQVDLRSGGEGFTPLFRQVLNDGVVLLRVVNDEDEGSPDRDPNISTLDDPEDLTSQARLELPKSLLSGIDWRGFGDPCRAVVMCPVQPTAGEGSNFDPLGFIVLGVNPRRPFDEDYNLFVQLLSRQLATSLASVVLFEEEIKRGQKAAELAALDRIHLSEQLAARTQEARQIENRFTHMANSSPAGLFIADSKGEIIYCNNTWYQITKIPRIPATSQQPSSALNWIDYVKNADQKYVRDLWSSLLVEKQDIAAEFRFKGEWTDESGNKSDTWVLFSCHPEFDTENNVLKTVFGNITDISSQKWAQGFQKRKMEEAVELKRQQENFIDITSHEMRNPLSSILQCADEITSSLTDLELSDDKEMDKSRIQSCVVAADTIVLCAQHQKRIVDDVLTLSKIDSQLLMVTPVDAQPLAILKSALKMFEGESSNAGIDLSLEVDKTYRDMKLDWVKFDPQRVGQILINLMTNAIKFTSSSEDRKASITIRLSASKTNPSEDPEPVVQYFHGGEGGATFIEKPEWGKGETIYLHFSVTDTGLGLDEEDRKLLFNRFTQVNPRTHVQYGGSGLGLFISRQLAQLQGGEIGVASEPGKGSTFAFFVKCRRSSAPRNPEIGIPAVLKTIDSKGRKAELNKTEISDAKREQRKNLPVLIVEDNIVNQRVLQTQLKNLGFTVYVANHGGEALDQIQKSNFWKASAVKDIRHIAIVLMDQEMPIMNGIEATKAIRRWEAEGRLTSHVPIIGVTANAREEQIQSLIDAGMDDVVSKPFRIPELLPKVESLAFAHPTA